MQSRPPAILRFFFLDTTFGIVLLAVCLIGGWLSFATMTRENYPDLAIPQATVLVEWPGATPSQIEEEVTKPLERAVRAIPGLRTYSSSSQNSAVLLAVEFEAETDLDTAMRDLRTRVEEARAEFPAGVHNPDIQQISVNDAPVLTYAILGEVDEDTLVRVSQSLVRDLEQVAGVRRAALLGARDRAVFIQLDPSRMRALGLSPTDVRQRIETSNQDLAWGSFDGQTATLPLYMEGRFRDLDAIRNVIVARIGGDRVVRLDEVADVSIALGARDRASQVSNGNEPFLPALTLSVLKRPGADTLAVIEEVRDRLATYTAGADWPVALELVEIASEGTLIEQSFAEVTSNLGQGIIAVFLILLVALTWREAIVAAIALPVAMLSALIALNLFGYTLNTLVILGAVIALGLIVDVFILVMEGMHDALYVRKKKFNEAALETVRIFALPALAGQATTILAMVPLLMISGIDGKFIRQIPISAIACLVTSVVVAFLIAIPLSRFLLGGSHQPKATMIDRLSERGGNLLKGILLRWPLRGRWTAAAFVAASVVALVVSLDAASRLPQIVYPPEDRRNIGVTIQLRPDAPLAETERVAELAGEALRAQPWIESVNLHIGQASPFALQTLFDNLVDTTSPNILGISVRLSPSEDRARPSWELTEEVRDLLDPIAAGTAGAELRLTSDMGGASSADPIQIEVTGPEVEELREIARELSGLLAVTPGVTDIRDNLGAFVTEVRFTARAEALNFYGLGEDALMDQIRIAMTADKIGTFSMPGAEPDLDIRLGMRFPSQDGIGGPREIFELETMSVVTPQGERIPINSLVESDLREVPSGIVHSDGRRAVTVSARTTTETPALGVIAQLTPQIEAMAADWPAGITWRLRGEAESADETFGSVGIALLVAVGLVFAVLALVFQSFRQPFIIMTLAPLSLIGVFGGFAALGIPVSFPAMIGIIALVGIIVNNGIVIVQVTNGHLASGLPVAQAAARGAADRLRPILTTSITTIVGLTPLALSSPAWYPLCMAIILGLGFGTVLSLVIVPALYLMLTPRQDTDRDASPPAPKKPQSSGEAGGLLRLSVPIVAGLTASTLLGVTDTIMISPLGTLPLAAASLTTAFLLIVQSAIYGFLSPIGIEAARRFGLGDMDGVRRVLRHGLVLGMAGGAICAVLMASGWFVLPLLGQPPEVLALGQFYWFAMSAFLIPVAVLMVVSQVLSAAGRAWTAALLAFGGVILNVPLNYVLIWGVGAWPGLGLVGAGIASFTADVIAAGVALTWLWRRGFLTRGTEPGLSRRLSIDGLPLSVGYMGEGAAYSLVGILLGLFGATALAANQIVQSVGGVLYMLPLGVATATSIRIGQAIGAGELDRRRPIARTALLLVGGWMSLVTVVLIFSGSSIADALSNDPAVIATATGMFIVVALIQVADGVQSTALGALRGARDFNWPTAFTLASYWVLALPLGAILGFALDLGPMGLWAGYGLGTAVAAVGLTIRFWRLTRTKPSLAGIRTQNRSAPDPA